MSAYDDIEHLSRPSSRRPAMDGADRAAQFAPFAALTGHKDAVAEAARLTEERRILADDEKAQLDRRLRRLRESLGECPVVRVEYFVEDSLKAGGAYACCEGPVRTIDEVGGLLIFREGAVVPLAAIDVLEFLEGLLG